MPKHTPEYGTHIAVPHRGKRRMRRLWRREPVVATSLYAHQIQIQDQTLRELNQTLDNLGERVKGGAEKGARDGQVGGESK